jgi:hypothetical protein
MKRLLQAQIPGCDGHPRRKSDFFYEPFTTTAHGEAGGGLRRFVELTILTFREALLLLIASTFIVVSTA